MITKLGVILSAYFFSAWLPSVVTFVIASLFFVNETTIHIPFIGPLLLPALALSLISILIAGIAQLATRRKKWSAIVNLVSFPLIGLIVAGGIAQIMVAELFDPKPDNFGKNIVIPADMKVSDPVDAFDEPGGPATDKLTDNIVAAFASNRIAGDSPRISTDLAALNEFSTTNRQKLIQCLSASPQWFVTEENGKQYACRRLLVGERWQNNLNGFYGVRLGDFQTRIVIGFDGPVFVEPFRREGNVTIAKVGTGDVPIKVRDDKEFGQGKESYFVVESPRASVEIFEQSRLDVRPATQMALADIKDELELALSYTNGMAYSPPAALKNGESEIQLAKGMQDGIYQVRAFVNPGEAGRGYIKVFEATQNTPLSADRIKPVSISRIGWSTNSNDKFRYQSEITVYEGDWGNFYPGRFELWFVPDSGKPERKLVERIFRIDGWMR